MAIIKNPAAVDSPYTTTNTAPTVLRASADGTTVLAAATAATTTTSTAADANANVSYYATGVEGIAGLANQGRVFDGANVYVTLDQQNFNTTNKIDNPAGSNGYVQFNNGGILGGSANLAFDGANLLTGGIKTDNYYYANGSPFSGSGSSYGNANVVALLSAFGSNAVFTTGNVTAGYILGNGSQLTGLPATYGNANVVANLAALGSNPVSTTGNITAGYILGNGSQLTGVSSSSISNGTSNVRIPVASGNVTISANTSAWNFSTDGNLTLPVNSVITNANVQDGEITLEANAAVNIYGGSTNTPGYSGGSVNVSGGDGGPDDGDNAGNGGEIEITGGTGAPAIDGGAGLGGAVQIVGGSGGTGNSSNSISAGSGGSVYISGGQSGDVDGDDDRAVDGPDVEIHGGLGSFNGATMVGRPGDVITQGGGNGWIGASGNVYSKTSSDGYSFHTWAYDNAGRTIFPNNTIATTDDLTIQIPKGSATSVTAVTGSSGSWESNPQTNLATTGGSGSGLTVTVTETGGYASEIAIVTAGYGYTAGDTITVTSGSSDATFTIGVAAANWGWAFDADGGTIFPTLNTQRGDDPSGTITGQTLLFGDASQEAIISTPDGNVTDGINSQRLVINPGQGSGSGEGGDIYLWAGRGGNGSGSGGDVKIRGGSGGPNTSGGTGGDGGYIRIDAGAAQGDGSAGFIEMTSGVGGENQPGGYINILAGTGGSDTDTVGGGDANITGGSGRVAGRGGNVNINGGQSANGLASYGNVNIAAGASTWNFNNNGNLTAPGVVTAITLSAVGNLVANNAMITQQISGANLDIVGTGNVGNLSTVGTVSANGNITTLSSFYAGNGATWQSEASYANVLFVGADVGEAYVQAAIVNTGGNGSSDWVSYANNGNTDSGWIDMGMTGNTFNDPAYTITDPNDGYIFVQGNTSFGGNLVLATGNTGTTKDIVLATGGFETGNIKARLVDATGEFSVVGNVSANNFIGNTAGYTIGYLNIPQVAFTGDATIAATDAGKHYYSTVSTANVLTIANNTSVSWAVGTAISLVNQGTGNITVAQGSGVSLYLAGNATAGNRTVATYGMATLMNVAANVWMINGTGVS